MIGFAAKKWSEGDHNQMFTAIDRYIARLIAVPLLSTLVISAMLLVLDKMLRLFDFVAAEGGPVNVVWKLLANMLPEYLSLGIPIGLLLGILLAFRKLATTSELDVLRAVGMGYGRLLRVPYMYAIGLALANLAIVGYLQPMSRYYYEGLRYELRSGALGASIKIGEFNRIGKNLGIRVEESRNDGRLLQGMFVRLQTPKSMVVSVSAQSGQFMASDDPDVILLRLKNGVLIQESPELTSPRVLTFASHDIPIDLPKIDSFRGRGGMDREFTLVELIKYGNDTTKPLNLRNEVRSNFHFRMVEVAMMLLIPLLAVALAVPPKRSTSALGVFLSIVMVVAYHKINEYADGMGSLGRIEPVIALWVPFALFAALILWMYHILAHKPGGQPIGALEVWAGKVGSRILGLFGTRRKKEAA